jgi:Protein of unknown function, DUF547
MPSVFWGNAMKKLILSAAVCLLALLWVAPEGLAAADEERFAPLTAFNPDSHEAVDHEFWDVILKGIVFERSFVLKTVVNAPPPTGTHIRPAAASAKGLDVNYVPYQLVKDEFKQYLLAITQYIGDLRHVKVSTLNRDEQLAYWLNLRNALVLRKIFNNHPVSKNDLKAWVLGGKEDPAEWDEQAVFVEDVPLSLRDIETLVTGNWKDPRVLYGFFYGAKGGPFLMNEAFHGATVYAQLERNGRDYINSTFAVKASSKGIVLPEPFEWYPALFSTDAARLAHVREFANSSVRKKLDRAGAGPVSFAMDWALNDLPSKLRPDSRLQLSNIATMTCSASVNEGGGC